MAERIGILTGGGDCPGLNAVCRKIAEREAMGRQFTLVVVAEGARAKGGEFVTHAGTVTNREARLGGIGGVGAAGRRPLTACCAPASASGPSSSSRRAGSATWSPCARRTPWR
jgi:6-phosphofructokinase